MTDKPFLSAPDDVLDEIHRAGPATRLREAGEEARANELTNAVAVLDRWLRERRAQMPEPTIRELVAMAHRQLRDDAEYKALLDAGDVTAAAQLVRSQARKEGGKLSHCWLTLISTELAAITGKNAPTTGEEKQS